MHRIDRTPHNGMTHGKPPRCRLRVERTSFVGRATELAELVQQFVDGARLLTVLGPPGVGKTRLVSRFAATAVQDGANAFERVVFVDLTEATCASDTLSAIAAALHAAPSLDTNDGGPAARLAETLVGMGRTLLVLDNFEGAAECAADTVGAIVDGAPATRALVSSRTRLHIEGEVCFDLPPLSVADAVALFRLRARAHGSAQSEDEAVSGLVRRLDCLPLAIELAAARSRSLSPAELLRQLSGGLYLLKSPHKDVAHRHRSLYDALDSSWRGLTADERDALALLSVFRGGFTVGAAAAVLARPMQRSMELLEALQDHSLVHCAQGASRGGDIRLGLYDSIREYARGKAEAAGLARGAELRHAHHFADLGNRVCGDAASPSLFIERDNLLAVSQRFHERRPLLAAQAVLGLHEVLRFDGPLAVPAAPLDAAVHAAAQESPSLAARLRVLRARYRMRTDQFGLAREDLQAAISLAAAAHDGPAEADARMVLAVIMRWEDHLEEAKTQARIARRVAVASRSQRVGAFAAFNLCCYHLLGGELDLARRRCLEGIATLEHVRDDVLWGLAHLRLGRMAMAEGDLDEAQQHLIRAREIHRQFRHENLWARDTCNLGIVAHARGDAKGASLLFSEAVSSMKRWGSLYRDGPFALMHLGAVRAELGRVARARSTFAEVRDRAAVPLTGYEGALFAATLGFLDLAHARASEKNGRHAEARKHTHRAAERLARAKPLLDGGPESLLVRSLERALARGRSLLAEPAQQAPGPTLCLGRQGRWFVAPDGCHVDLGRRRALAAILEVLAERRQGAPGEAVPLADLYAAGWPDDRARFRSRDDRLYSAIAQLRKLGLREVLLNHGGGYLIAPAVAISWNKPDACCEA